MLISLDRERCTKCGICINSKKGYCIDEKDGYPVFDEKVCNTCQKCVAICPTQAIMVNNIHPRKITAKPDLTPDQLQSLMEQRRSIKKYSGKTIPAGTLERIISAAKWAPNQNKNVSVLVITDEQVLKKINACAMGFDRMLKRVLFSFPPFTWLAKLFSGKIEVIRKKVEYSLKVRNSTVFSNAAALVVLCGSKRVPVTQASAPYMMASMMYMAESCGVGSCLLDSVLLTIRTNRKAKKLLGIREDVLAVMSLGYPGEKIINIPQGYEPDVYHNRIEEK